MSRSEGGAVGPPAKAGAREDPGGRFTLPRSRTAGSGACLNCGTVLAGPFCHYCGQPDRRLMRFFPVLLRELLEDLVNFDSRFLRTLMPLLFKPGRLTRDYMDGKRFRYTPPVRLYLLSSVILFLLAALVSTAPLVVGGDVETGDVVIAPGNSEDEGLPRTLDDLDLQFGDEPWDRETNPLIIPFVPDRLNDWINDEIAESPRKVQDIAENPRLFVNEMLDLLPAAMFVLLPVVALILKLSYLFSNRYYVEHLILSLHNHAFLFVSMVALILIDSVRTPVSGWPAVGGATELMAAAVRLWIPVYLVWSLKTVYEQGWPKTLAKGVAIGIGYSFLLGLVTAFVALLGFLLI